MDDNTNMQQIVRTISLSNALWEKISTYQHANRIDSRIDAIRQMLESAYDAWVTRSTP